MLDLPPAQPRVPVQEPISTNSVVRINLNRAQATALAGRLLNTLKQNHEDPIEAPPAHDYQGELTRILAEGLGIDQATVAKGLGLCGGGGQQRCHDCTGKDP
jgi:hypothetical protein